MKGSDRVSRPEPAQKGPDRRFPPLKDRPLGAAAPRTGPTSSASTGGKTVEEVVAEVVRTGYEVVEENIRQGRQAAERLRLGTYQSGDIPDDMGMVVNRLVRLGMDLSTTWFQLVAAVLRDPRLLSALEDTGPSRPPGTRRTPGRAAPPRIIHRVRCRRKFDVLPTLSRVTSPAVPTVAGLFSSEADVDPIRSVTLKYDPHARSLVLDIDVPDAQPSGTYHGVFIDRDTNEPVGTVRLRIFG
jgi:hypothetical protein